MSDDAHWRVGYDRGTNGTVVVVGAEGMGKRWRVDRSILAIASDVDAERMTMKGSVSTSWRSDVGTNAIVYVSYGEFPP